MNSTYARIRERRNWPIKLLSRSAAQAKTSLQGQPCCADRRSSTADLRGTLRTNWGSLPTQMYQKTAKHCAERLADIHGLEQQNHQWCAHRLQSPLNKGPWKIVSTRQNSAKIKPKLGQIEPKNPSRTGNIAEQLGNREC